MTLGIRKVVVVGLIGGIILVANIAIVAHWFNDLGVIDGAARIRKEFLTGTAITIIIALLILLVKPHGNSSAWIRRCAVCDHRILRGKYCSECGSRV